MKYLLMLANKVNYYFFVLFCSLLNYKLTYVDVHEL